MFPRKSHWVGTLFYQMLQEITGGETILMEVATRLQQYETLNIKM